MNTFDEDEIVATGYDDQEIRIAYKNVKTLQEYFGVHTINVGNMSIAGPKKEYIKINTFDGGVFEIPRTPDNDTAVLSFLLRKSRS